MGSGDVRRPTGLATDVSTSSLPTTATIAFSTSTVPSILSPRSRRVTHPLLTRESLSSRRGSLAGRRIVCARRRESAVVKFGPTMKFERSFGGLMTAGEAPTPAEDPRWRDDHVYVWSRQAPGIRHVGHYLRTIGKDSWLTRRASRSRRAGFSS